VNLILIERAEVGDGGVVLLSDARADHLLNVLKIAVGDRVRLGVLDGPCGSGTATAVTAGTVMLRCAFAPDAPVRPRVDLILALPRPKVMRRLWAPIAALGVGRIMVTNASRVERNYFDTHVLTPACYRPLLIEGLQQARDTRLPDVSVHRQFKPFIEDDLDRLTGSGLRLAGDPAATGRAADAVGKRRDERVVLAVGPEGGWNDFERDLLSAHRFERISLGPRTLRTDTATIALLALVHHALA
jgi:16S rRNA (uracil1498-N3)-methyltransferase